MEKITHLFFLLISGFITAQSTERTTKPFELGVIETMWSNELSESRILNIYLPPDYNKDAGTTYPVIYLLDGSANEDFIHIVGLVQNCSFPWINKIPPSIVVGIANKDRERDFSFPSESEQDKKQFPTAGGSQKFISFIEKELQPFIEKNYKTAIHKTLIGQSFGGLLAATILLEHPSLFNTYIIVSPSLWWNNGSLLVQQGKHTEIAKLKFLQGTKIYIGVGNEGSMPGREKYVMQSVAKQLADNLQNSGNKNIHVFFDYLPSETHATISHQAVYNAFKLVGEGNKK